MKSFPKNLLYKNNYRFDNPHPRTLYKQTNLMSLNDLVPIAAACGTLGDSKQIPFGWYLIIIIGKFI